MFLHCHERVVYERQQGAQLLLDLTVTYATPAHTRRFALQVIDLTRIWSNRASGIIEFDDLPALDAPVYI